MPDKHTMKIGEDEVAIESKFGQPLLSRYWAGQHFILCQYALLHTWPLLVYLQPVVRQLLFTCF